MNPHPTDLLAEHFGDDSNDSFGAIDPELMLEQILADSNLIQHLTRTRSEGIETIAGYFRCTFLPGQQRHILHIPFVPPLAKIPTVDALVTDNAEVRVRVTERQKFGTRLEVVLPQPANEKFSLLVEAISQAPV